MYSSLPGFSTDNQNTALAGLPVDGNVQKSLIMEDLSLPFFSLNIVVLHYSLFICVLLAEASGHSISGICAWYSSSSVGGPWL